MKALAQLTEHALGEPAEEASPAVLCRVNRLGRSRQRLLGVAVLLEPTVVGRVPDLVRSIPHA